jgi:serine/threonine protein kinase/formylglycine-generating enzyme required for sulfatase activity
MRPKRGPWSGPRAGQTFVPIDTPFDQSTPKIGGLFSGGGRSDYFSEPTANVNPSNPEDATQKEGHGNTLAGESGDAHPAPPQIGRYRIEKLLGKGGFGSVYLAHDGELDRYVAVKIPHPSLIKRPEDAQSYLKEARTVANLDHPNIVPVHDVGGTADFPCYVVSKYVPGMDLATTIQSRRFNSLEAAELVATVAGALHYAHKQGLVHRDVKPGNILIDNDGNPYVVDFGLALREEDVGKGPKHAGTAAYMSPEQARGEGHRVDGRSDIFSLGVVLYQLLVGRRPFRGDTQAELLEQVVSYEPRPLRQYDEKLPKELERICVRAMSKRVSERYSSAHDLAEDLRHFVTEQTAIQGGSSQAGLATVATEVTSDTRASRPPTSSGSSVMAGSTATEVTATNSGPNASDHSVQIVPKGLRSFDAHDADFFLELLPGPRDRAGLPESLRFWKIRIEEVDPEQTFSVGLIYGQSGCGKSSLIKAGLLPRLSDDVIPVYVEATPDETETRLLRGLRKRCPALEGHLKLKDSLTALRRGTGIPSGKKLLIVLDQFEQWLHVKNPEDSQLVQALRQCDGGRVQCVVLVRDDFWMAATRFMRELDLRLLEGQNSAAVDLFPVSHAERVLAAFGRAFGVLPENATKTSSEQRDFLKQSALGLAEEGKVVCVRLALFAEMVKGKSWTPATLKQAGGTKGVGATFLEETFSASTAPPEHRYHEKAASKVLKALLPDSGTDIKGEMKSHDELLRVSGYRRSPSEFDGLITILDRELRLVTPTDPDGRHGDEDASSVAETGQKYYQLTHDYLVHSLRDWLTRKQKETRAGRAELQMNDLAAVWGSKREKRYLPSLTESINLRFRTNIRSWTQPQREMMKAAKWYHLARSLAVLTVLAVITIVGWQWVSMERARNSHFLVDAAVDALQNSRGDVVPYAIADLADFPQSMVIDALRRRIPISSGHRRLALSYALASLGQVDHREIVAEIWAAPRSECGNIATALSLDSESSRRSLSAAIEAAEAIQNWRLKTRLATVALIIGDTRHAADMLRTKDRPDPIERTLFINQFSDWNDHLEEVAKTVRATRDDSLSSGICLAVGRIPAEEFTDEEQVVWSSLMRELFVQHPSAGVHSAAGWALKRWKVDLPRATRESSRQVGVQWRTTREGLTLLSLSPGAFSRTTPDGQPVEVRVEDEFLIGDREISVELFRRFITDDRYAGEKPVNWLGENEGVSPTESHPVQQVSWHDAVMFCNWLSDREDRDACYVRGGNGKNDWAWVIESNGYHLPTDAQWEFACRAGTDTRFACGDDDSFLDQYAVFRREDHADPCGNRLCNAWGLFDMHGNVWEWVGAYSPEIAEESSDQGRRVQPSTKMLRGGSRGGTATQVQSDSRGWHRPTHRSLALGFRVVCRP